MSLLILIPLFHSSAGILLDWEDYYEPAHLTGGMTQQKGELEIPQTGLYYIYGQIYFQMDDHSSKETSMVHFIYKKTGPHLKILLRTILTKC